MPAASIVLRVLMTDRRSYRGRERALIQTPTRQSSSHSSAVPGGRVRRDCRRCTGWAVGKEFSNFHRQPCDQFAVLFLPAHCAGSPRFRAFPCVFGALLLRLFQCGLLHQNALPFITPARPAEAHDNGGAFAMPGGTPRQRSIAGRKILKIAEPRAWQAQRLCHFHKKETASRKLGAAFGTRGVPQNFEDNRRRRATQFLRELRLFALGQ
jgi:hypothetical protein